MPKSPPETPKSKSKNTTRHVKIKSAVYQTLMKIVKRAGNFSTPAQFIWKSVGTVFQKRRLTSIGPYPLLNQEGLHASPIRSFGHRTEASYATKTGMTLSQTSQSTSAPRMRNPWHLKSWRVPAGTGAGIQ